MSAPLAFARFMSVTDRQTDHDIIMYVAIADMTDILRDATNCSSC